MTDYREFANEGIEWIASMVEQCPRRVVGSSDERAAHESMAEDLRRLGLHVELPGFRHPRSLYAIMSLHFFVVLAGTATAIAGFPMIGFAIQIFAATSYWAESTKRLKVLSRLFRQHDTQNLVATRPATGDPVHRIAFVGHIDAAFTGWIFNPKMIKAALTPPPIPGLGFVTRGMLMAELSALATAILSLAMAFVEVDPQWLWYVAAGVLSIPAFLTAVLNLQVVLRNETVPGANDNLTGCYAVLRLARRLVDVHENMEFVFVATGSEEAGTGGAWELAESVDWSKVNTTVVGLDTLSNGDLRYFQEGELSYLDVPPKLEALVKETIPHVERYAIPSGATDALPFLVRGWPAFTLGCVDRELRAPRHYHHPTDTPENIDLEEFAASLQSIDKFVDALINSVATD